MRPQQSALSGSLHRFYRRFLLGRGVDELAVDEELGWVMVRRAGVAKARTGGRISPHFSRRAGARPFAMRNGPHRKGLQARNRQVVVDSLWQTKKWGQAPILLRQGVSSVSGLYAKIGASPHFFPRLARCEKSELVESPEILS